VLSISCIIAALENYGLIYHAKRLYEVFELPPEGENMVSECLNMLKNAV
jgi:hypothetical protein